MTLAKHIELKEEKKKNKLKIKSDIFNFIHAEVELYGGDQIHTLINVKSQLLKKLTDLDYGKGITDCSALNHLAVKEVKNDLENLKIKLNEIIEIVWYFLSIVKYNKEIYKKNEDETLEEIKGNDDIF